MTIHSVNEDANLVELNEDTNLVDINEGINPVELSKNTNKLVLDEDIDKEELESFILESKAVDLEVIDINKKSHMADYIIIATGTSNRHITSMAEKIKQFCKEKGFIANIEGDKVSGWVLIDLGNIIVHLFESQVREYYNLEKLWKKL